MFVIINNFLPFQDIFEWILLVFAIKGLVIGVPSMERWVCYDSEPKTLEFKTSKKQKIVSFCMESYLPDRACPLLLFFKIMILWR